MEAKSLFLWAQQFEGVTETYEEMNDGKDIILIYNEIFEQNIEISENSKVNFSNFTKGIEENTNYTFTALIINDISKEEIVKALRILFFVSKSNPKFNSKFEKLAASNKIFLKKITEDKITIKN